MELVQKPPEVENQKIKSLDRIRVALQMAAFSFIPLIITEILTPILGYRDYYGSILEGYFYAFFDRGFLYFVTTLFVTWIMLTIFVDKSQLRKFRYIMMIVIALFILGMFFYTYNS